jgi:hypothetical protein
VYVWEVPASSNSAPLQDPGRTNRVAGVFEFFGYSSLRLSFEQPSKVTFYFLDWRASHRSEELRMVDEASDRIIGETEVSAFEGGLYLTWMVRGAVRVEFRESGGELLYGSPLLAGLFLGGPVRFAAPVLTMHSQGKAFSLNISAPAGISYLLEKSTDLRNWLPRSSGRLDTPEVNVTLDPAEAPASAFFRVQFH